MGCFVFMDGVSTAEEGGYKFDDSWSDYTDGTVMQLLAVILAI